MRPLNEAGNKARWPRQSTIFQMNQTSPIRIAARYVQILNCIGIASVVTIENVANSNDDGTEEGNVAISDLNSLYPPRI